MESSTKLHIDFGIPEHGWLPTIFQYQDYKLELEISDVPVDPMIQLCNALIGINKGIHEPTRIIWHLEPYCYYLQLKFENGRYIAIIYESDEFDSPAKLTKEITGTYDEIILPLFRGLKKFWSHSSKKPHWDKLDSKRIDELTKLTKEEKEHNIM